MEASAVMIRRTASSSIIALWTVPAATMPTGRIIYLKTGEGRLWIATCLGGIFVVDKQNLMRSSGGPYMAEKTYSIHNGLSGMFINQLIPDREGNVWALLYNSANSIEKINPRTGEITHIAPDELTGERTPNFILSAQDGHIWIGFPVV